MTTPIPRFKDLTPKIYSFGKFVLDLNAACLTSDGEEIKLRPKSFELLGYFVANSGRLLAKDELISAVWPDAFVGDDSLVQCVRDIRRALEDKKQQVLKTVPRRGYIFQAYVHSLRDGATPQAATTQTATKDVVRPEMRVVSPAEMNPAAGVRRRWPMVVTGFAVLVVLVGSLAWLLKAKSEPQRMRAVPLTSYRGMERNPALSPDGDTVAFTWNGENENNFDIYLLPVGSSNPQRLTTDPAEDTSPEWSPDGRRIAFLRRLDGRRSQLILIPSTGGPEHVLAETGNRIVGGTGVSSIRKDLAWAPDGQWIAVPHFNGDESPQGIYLVSVLDGSKRQLTRPGLGGVSYRS